MIGFCMGRVAIFHADSEETAETYIMERMRAPDLAAYERHLSTCAECTDCVERTRRFIAAITAAASLVKQASSQE